MVFIMYFFHFCSHTCWYDYSFTSHYESTFGCGFLPVANIKSQILREIIFAVRLDLHIDISKHKKYVVSYHGTSYPAESVILHGV